LLVGLGMWWVYFDFVGRRPFRPSPLPMYIWVYLHFLLYAVIVIAGIAMSEIVNGQRHAFIAELAGLAIGAFLVIVGIFETVLARKPDEPTHPVKSPLLKIACAPIAGVAGYVASGAAQLSLMFAPLVVQMLYGLFVWFTQDLEEAREHAH